MRTIHVEIAGNKILMNNPASMLEKKSTIKNINETRDLETDAEKTAYKLPNGELYVPATAIKGAMLDASKMMKIQKRSAKSYIAGGVIIQPSEIPLGTKKYDIDIRTVVIKQAGRVVKARACVKNWKLKFDIVFNESLISDTPDGHEVLRRVITEAGQRVGILDFRPTKSGDFGMFEVKKFEVD